VGDFKRTSDKHLSGAQAHALKVLHIQEDNEGWAAFRTLADIGVKAVTLRLLERFGFVEKSMRVIHGMNPNVKFPHYRLTDTGKPRARELYDATPLDGSNR
jgi:hypothetical protein